MPMIAGNSEPRLTFQPRGWRDDGGSSEPTSHAARPCSKAPCTFVKGVVAIDGLPQDGRPKSPSPGAPMSASRA